MNVETHIRPTPRPFTAAAIARRADEATFIQGVHAGHVDAVEQLESMARGLVYDLRMYRDLRDQSHRRAVDHHVYDRLAGVTWMTLMRVLAIRRALKGESR